MGRSFIAAGKSFLHMLDTVHYQGISLELGISSLFVETDLKGRLPNGSSILLLS